MESMIIISGIWIAILPYMKWNKVGRKISLFHLITGLYTCISIIGYMINDELFSYIWVQVAYIIMCILLMLDIIEKLKEPKVGMSVLAIATSILGLILSIVVFLVDSKEISSAIIMIAGSMIILSIPFYRVNSCSIKSKK